MWRRLPQIQFHRNRRKMSPLRPAHPAEIVRRDRRRPGPPARTHTVAAGETAVRIARRYGISLDALLAANPGLEPRRMRVGQVLNIPPP